MNVGLCTISNKEWPIEDVIDLAADLGFDGIEVWGEEPHVGDRSSERMESIRSDCADAGLEIPVYGSYLRPGTDGYEAEWETELDAAETLGADLIRIWAGDVEFGDHTEEEWSAVVEDLTHLTERADERGIGVTVEKHAGTLTNRAAGARALIEDVGAENCGINWQPSWDLTAGEILADLEALWTTIRDDRALDVIEAGLVAIEQPFPREFALADRVGEALDRWDGPPVIIDESDAEPGDLGRALDLGYAGTSVKSCKGICKSVANACQSTSG